MSGLKPTDFPNIALPLTGIEEVYTQTGGVNSKFTVQDIWDSKYKTYHARIKQIGTNAPFEAFLYENGLGDMVWSYVAVGDYNLTSINSSFNLNRTVLPNDYAISVDGFIRGTVYFSLIDESTINIKVWDGTGNQTDDLFIGGDRNYFNLEIKVYN